MPFSSTTDKTFITPFKTINGDIELERQLDRAFELLRTTNRESLNLVPEATLDWDQIVNRDSVTNWFYQSGEPTGAGEEAGDFWKDSDDNKIWRYDGADWVEVQDNDIAQSLSDAFDAQQTADTKIKTYAQTTAPSGEGEEFGDIWIDTNDGNHLYRYNGSSWVDYEQLAATWSQINSIPSALRQIFYQPTAPTAGHSSGDYWIDSDIDRIYKYNGSSWLSIPDDDISTAISDAADAQSTADGKIYVWAQASPPTADAVGDIWIDTDDDDHLYRWSGSVWADYEQLSATWARVADIPDDLVQIFYQSAAPVSGHETGDFWKDSDDNIIYRYNGSAWLEVQDDDVALAISDAANAQSTADGKVYVWAQTSSPTADGTGDLWIDTDDNDHLYRWSGSAWVDYEQLSADWSLINDILVATGDIDDEAVNSMLSVVQNSLAKALVYNTWTEVDDITVTTTDADYVRITVEVQFVSVDSNTSDYNVIRSRLLRNTTPVIGATFIASQRIVSGNSSTANEHKDPRETYIFYDTSPATGSNTYNFQCFALYDEGGSYVEVYAIDAFTIAAEVVKK